MTNNEETVTGVN